MAAQIVVNCPHVIVFHGIQRGPAIPALICFQVFPCQFSVGAVAHDHVVGVIRLQAAGHNDKIRVCRQNLLGGDIYRSALLTRGNVDAAAFTNLCAPHLLGPGIADDAGTAAELHVDTGAVLIGKILQAVVDKVHLLLIEPRKLCGPFFLPHDLSDQLNALLMGLNGLLMEIKEHNLNSCLMQQIKGGLQRVVIRSGRGGQNHIRLQRNDCLNADIPVVAYVRDRFQCGKRFGVSVVGIVPTALPVFVTPSDQLVYTRFTGNGQIFLQIEGNNDTLYVGGQCHRPAFQIRYFHGAGIRFPGGGRCTYSAVRCRSTAGS